MVIHYEGSMAMWVIEPHQAGGKCVLMMHLAQLYTAIQTFCFRNIGGQQFENV
jgi:hypothetical protein